MDSSDNTKFTKEKFVFERIKEDKDGKTRVVHCVDPDILCSEIQKKFQSDNEKFQG